MSVAVFLATFIVITMIVLREPNKKKKDRKTKVICNYKGHILEEYVIGLKYSAKKKNVRI